MPQAYVAKLAKEKNMSIAEAEAIWEKAKKVAGEGATYSVITSIFKKMMHERSEKKKGSVVKKKK